LEGAKCKDCGKVHYPIKALCFCGSRDFESLKLSGQGKILTFTEIGAGGEAFAEMAPFCIGIVELKEGPKITAQITDAELKDLSINQKVQATFRKFYASGEKGAIHYGLKFKPV
jgi:uncharacterized OB-fold protein